MYLGFFCPILGSNERGVSLSRIKWGAGAKVDADDARPEPLAGIGAILSMLTGVHVQQSIQMFWIASFGRGTLHIPTHDEMR